MKKITVIGIDLAKKNWQLHGNDEKGRRILKKSLTPKKAYELLANTPACVVGLEACGGAHFAARKLRAMGHTPKIIAPQFVAAFVKGNKNDISDAEAIAEAAGRPNMRFVPIKEVHHQDMQNYHRIRERLIANKTALTNQIRGILFEYGISLAKGDKALKSCLVEIASDSQMRVFPEVTRVLREQLVDLYQELTEILDKLDVIDEKLNLIACQNEQCKKLMKIRGIGPIIATALVCCVCQLSEFKNGRHLAAWLGLVPGHKQTGGPNGKTIMLPITKRGDRYIRKLLIQGARTVVKTADKKSDPLSKWISKLKKAKGFNKAAVALANKNARIIWAVLSKKEAYNEKLASAA